MRRSRPEQGVAGRRLSPAEGVAAYWHAVARVPIAAQGALPPQKSAGTDLCACTDAPKFYMVSWHANGIYSFLRVCLRLVKTPDFAKNIGIKGAGSPGGGCDVKEVIVTGVIGTAGWSDGMLRKRWLFRELCRNTCGKYVLLRTTPRL